MDFETETQFNRLGKRLRDEDSGELNTAVWDEQPKHRKLVFRTPSLGQSTGIFINTQNQYQPPFSHSQPNPHTPTLTPADSSSDSSNAEIRSPPLGPSVAVPSTVFTPADDDVDMEVDGGDIFIDEPNTPRQGYGVGSPMVSPKSQTPTRAGSRDSKHGKLAPILLASPAGPASDLRTRVPTPIYGHFSTHSGENATASQTAGQVAAGGSGSPLPHHSRSNHYNIALYPHHHLQERKMPSPISETFAHEGSTSSAAGSGGSRLTNSASIHPLQTGHLSIICDEDMATSPASPTIPNASLTTARSSSAGPRRRSDAISASPGDNGVPAMEIAQQNTDQCDTLDSATSDGATALSAHKASFHMGFKADCKMCQDRVPGHFNHISHARA